MILKIAFLVFALGFINCIQAEFNLTIVHIADFHSHWFEFDENKHDCSQQESEEGKCFGGFPRLLTFLRDIRSKEKNVIVLSSGEFFLGRSLYALHGWKLAHSLLPRIELDAMSLSNHDFDSSMFELSAFLYAMKFPVLCANMWSRNSSYIYSRVNKSVVIDVDGHKVGIVGYLHRNALKKSKSAVSVKFLPEIPALQKEVQRLESEGVNKIIALGHAGYYTDLEIAKKVKGVDIVIGGDSDIMLFNPGPDANESSQIGNIHGNYPRVHQHEPEIENDAILTNRTLVLHIPQHGMHVGVLRATFDDTGKIIHESGEPVLLDSSIPQDKDTLKFMEYARSHLEIHSEHSRLPHESEVLGRTKKHLDGNPRNCRMRECSFGNFIADAFLHEFTFHYRNKSEHRDRHEQWGPIDAVVFNSGPIKRSIEPGEIKIKDIIKSVCLGGFIKRVYMSGKHLRDMMEHSVKHYDPMGITPPGAFLQVAGIKVEYDLSQLPGNRVRSLQIRSRDGSLYLPVKLYKTYVIGMPHFLATGRDGYYDFEEANEEDFGQFDAQLIVEYLKRKFHVEPIIDGRIKFYEPENPNENLTKTPPLLFGEPLSKVHDQLNLQMDSIGQNNFEDSEITTENISQDKSVRNQINSNKDNIKVHITEQKKSFGDLYELHTSSKIERELKAENQVLESNNSAVQKSLDSLEFTSEENKSSLQSETGIGNQTVSEKSNSAILTRIDEKSNISQNSDLLNDLKAGNISLIEEFLKILSNSSAGNFSFSVEKLSTLISNLSEKPFPPNNSVFDLKKLLKKRSVSEFLEDGRNITNFFEFEDYIPLIEQFLHGVFKNISKSNSTSMESAVKNFLKHLSNSSAENFPSTLEKLSKLMSNLSEMILQANSTFNLKKWLKNLSVSEFLEDGKNIIKHVGSKDFIPFMERLLHGVFKNHSNVNSTIMELVVEHFLKKLLNSSTENFPSTSEKLSTLMPNISEIFLQANSTFDFKELLKKRSVSVFAEKDPNITNFEFEDYFPFMETNFHGAFEDIITNANSTSIGSIARKMLENVISKGNTTEDAENDKDEDRAKSQAELLGTGMEIVKSIVGEDILKTIFSEIQNLTEKANVSISDM